MADKLMYIPNDDTHNYPFCRLQIVVDTFGDPSYKQTHRQTSCYFYTNIITREGGKTSKIVFRWVTYP